ncbi:hypothetical protein ASE92_17295 [Pedobacter sp. Leaf41]|uniref:hypothetical protein n=1 Tax=Pedobacter sp. Leaf41 TaxID=1736218 RepID=UPI000702C7E7|nr:hypothetical protein [Pedobacter sp. Leaf41]KQN32361.1 hypothetical protein ASE92_17295 [Pedobacter sp. Leaf41]
MKKTLSYFLTLLGLIIIAFGIFLTFNELKLVLKYSSLQKANPDQTILTQYGTTASSYLNQAWKSLAIWASLTLIGWIIIYYSDKFLKTKRWINDEYAPLFVIAILALPVYYFFSSL